MHTFSKFFQSLSASRKHFAFCLAIFLLYGVPFVANADIGTNFNPQGQNDSVYQLFNSHPSLDVTQTLGTGLIGTVTAIAAVPYFSQSSGSTNWSAQILCFTDAAYSIGCTNSATGTASISQSGVGQWATTTISAYTLNSGNYYELLLDMQSRGSGTFTTTFFDWGTYSTSTDQYPNGAGTLGNADGIQAGTLHDYVFNIGSASLYAPPTNTTTHIIGVTPIDGATVSTSTSAMVGIQVYVNPADIGQPLTVSLNIDNHGLSSTQLVGPLFAGLQESSETADFTFTASTTGETDFTATTSLEVLGRHYVTASIYSAPYFSFFGLFSLGGQTYDATSTSFLVATSSPYDMVVQGNIANAIAAEAATSTNCAFGANFSALGCIYYWVEFQPVLMSPVLDSLISTGATGTPAGFFAHVPFGYVTRFAKIMLGGATTSLPTFTYTAGSSSPAVLQAAGPLTIDFFSYFGEVTAIKADDGSNKDIWDIIDPYFTVLVAFAVLFVILGDLLGFDFSSDPDDFSDRQKYQIEGMKQQQRAEYPFGKGRVGYDKKGKNI